MTPKTKKLLRTIARGWWLILLLCVVGAGAAILLHTFVIPSQYKATSTVYIMDQPTDQNGQNTYNNLLGGELIATDAKAMMQSNAVLEPAAQALGYTGASVFEDILSISSGDSPRIISVSIESEEARFSMEGVNAIVESFVSQSQNFFPGYRFSIIDAASLPTSAESGGTIRTVLASGLSGVVLAVLILILWNRGKRGKDGAVQPQSQINV